MKIKAYMIVAIFPILFTVLGCATPTAVDCNSSNRNIFTIQYCLSSKGKESYAGKSNAMEIELYNLESQYAKKITESEYLRKELSRASNELAHIKNSVSSLERELIELQGKYNKSNKNYDISEEYKNEIIGYLYSLKKELDKVYEIELPQKIITHEVAQNKMHISNEINKLLTTISQVKTAPAQASWLIVRKTVAKRLRFIIDLLDGFKVLVDGYVIGRDFYN